MSDDTSKTMPAPSDQTNRPRPTAVGTSPRWSRTRRTSDDGNLPVETVLHGIELCAAMRATCPGIPTGIFCLDKLMGGLHPEHLVVVSGGPGVGKTSFLLNVALNSGACGIPTLVVTGEQASFELEERMLAILSDIDCGRLHRGELEYLDWKNKLHPASRELLTRPLEVYDPPIARIDAIEGYCQEFFLQDWTSPERVRKATNPEGGLLIVDSLHSILPRYRSDTAERDLSETVRALKALGRELGISVLLTSHLNRSGDSYSQTPRLTDLRGSGAIEYTADAVIFLTEAEDKMLLTLAKSRFGRCGETLATFERSSGRFSG